MREFALTAHPLLRGMELRNISSLLSIFLMADECRELLPGHMSKGTYMGNGRHDRCTTCGHLNCTLYRYEVCEECLWKSRAEQMLARRQTGERIVGRKRRIIRLMLKRLWDDVVSISSKILKAPTSPHD